MAKQTDNYQPIGFRNAATLFQSSDGTTTKDILSAGADDSIVTAIVITSTDGTLRKVQLILNDGTTDFVITTLAVPGNSGTGGPVSVDALAAAFLPLVAGKRVLTLKAGWKLRAVLPVATTGDVVVFAMGQDY